ncbi:hypothetical protein GCM10027285_13280 [Oleiagrimonas citrea]
MLAFVSLAAYGQEPSSISVPPGAFAIKHFPILGGRAFQTQFKLNAAYPATPALEYYKAHMAKPWVMCTWAPKWSHFIDAQTPTRFAVYQQLYMWVNPKLQRTLMLSMRYLAPESSGHAPNNDIQHIVLVEYMSTNVANTIQQLHLRCLSGSLVAH